MASQNCTKNEGFRWTPKSDEAAQLVAEDRLTNEQIAQKVGVSRRTVDTWKTHPEFQQRVNSHVLEFRETVRKRGVAIVENRIDRLQTDWMNLQAIREARASRYRQMREAQGRAGLGEILGQDSNSLTANLEGISTDYIPAEAETGLVILSETFSKMGKRQEWAIDGTLLSEMRAIEQQAAKELGQWEDKLRHVGAVGIVSLPLQKLSDADLDQLETLATKLVGE